MLSRTLPLFAIIALGGMCAAARLFPSTPAAIGVLNRFALYIGFPLLIVAGLASDALALPDGLAFYALHIAGAGLMLGAAWAVSRPAPLRRHGGAIVLGALFGNIAYLGIPFIGSVLSPAASGLASLSAALHIALAMLFGPWLLLRWSPGGRSDGARLVRRVLRQPLVWAPVAGLAVRYGGPVREPILSVAGPVGSAAGPVALFMIGMYLWESRAHLTRAHAPALVTTGLKLMVYPAAVALLLLLGARAYLSNTEAAVLVLQAGCRWRSRRSRWPRTTGRARTRWPRPSSCPR